MDKISKYLPRLQDILFLSFFLAVLLLGNRMINLDGDLPRHLLTGKYILQAGEIPSTELFIYPYFGKPYVSHEWLADVFYHFAYSLAGLKGLVVFSALILSATFYLIYRSITVRYNLRIVSFVLVLLGALATSLNWAMRPHLISMLFLALWLIWADKLWRGEKISLWVFPSFMAIWSNMHGEFIAGILVLFSYAAGWVIEFLWDYKGANKDIGKKLWAALIFSIFASFLNPGGISPWKEMFGFVNNQYMMSRMLEANPPNFQMPETRILLALIGISIFLLAANRNKLFAGQGFLLAGFTAMSLIAFRNIHLYGIVAPFVLGETLVSVSNIPVIPRLENTLRTIETKVKGAYWVLVPSLFLSGLVLTSPIASRLYQFDKSTFPVDAVNWLENNPQDGRMFNDLNWGGYITLHTYPDQLAFADSIADKSGDVTKQYETIIRLLPGWEEILQEHNIQWAIIPPSTPLADKLQNELGWKVLYKDKTSIILRK